MSHAAITVENLSKVYRLGVKEEAPDTLASAVTGFVRSPLRNLQRLRRLSRFKADEDSPDVLWALKDVSFEVPEGEVLGVIGRNGAGKSTLLKILSRITEPTSGRAVIRGRVSSLLEVGTGFHPELTGRDNIYMNGTILGMTKREIDRKFDEIVDFSGVERFLDTPIKRYSSGMQVRLAFSVAAHLEPEILIIDEVLAVGDMEFQKKCLGKMHAVAESGRTVLFVSHNMAAVEELCTRGIVLRAGGLCCDSSAKQAVQVYLTSSELKVKGVGHRFHPVNDLRHGLAGFSVRELRISSEGRVSCAGYPAGALLEIQIICESSVELTHPTVCIRISNRLGQVIAEFHSLRSGGRLPSRLSGLFAISCQVRDLLLVPGEYTLRLDLKQQGKWFFVCEKAGVLNILPNTIEGVGKGPSIPGVFILARQSWSSEVIMCQGSLCEPALDDE